jgi:hypothetical protein
MQITDATPRLFTVIAAFRITAGHAGDESEIGKIRTLPFAVVAVTDAQAVERCAPLASLRHHPDLRIYVETTARSRWTAEHYPQGMLCASLDGRRDVVDPAAFHHWASYTTRAEYCDGLTVPPHYRAVTTAELQQAGAA